MHRRHGVKPLPGGRGFSRRNVLAPAPKAMLHSGGDERLRVDPQTGRSIYGFALDGDANEVHFGSSTASSLSRRGRTAADEAWRHLAPPNRIGRVSSTQW